MQHHFYKYFVCYKNVSSTLVIGLVFILIFFFVSMQSKAETVDFQLPDMEGKPVKLSDFRGKWVVVNYWATWCPPCLTEIPELIEFYETHKDKDAVVLGVAFEDIETSVLKEFVDSYFISYPVVRMKPAPKHELGPITGLPTSFLVSPEGELVGTQVGPVTAKSIESFISQSESPESKQESKKAKLSIK